MAIKKHHRFQRLAALELPKDALEHRAERLGGDRIKYLAHVRVARDTLNAVDGVQIALGPLFVKGEERGALRENMANADMSASVKVILLPSRR